MSPDTAALAPALQLDQVCVSYGGIRALSGVTLTVPAGSVVALLGPNGAGKTTTLRAVSGVIPVESGRITVGGCRVDGRPPHVVARHGVVHVPEGRGIFPSLTVRENLELSGRVVGRDVDPVEAGVARFPILGERLGVAAGTLSGGQQQMLALARALSSKPRLLMVDEISMGLAPIVVVQLFDALREHALAGTSLLLVEQYVETALELADYVYVLEKGVVCDVGEANDVRAGGLVSTYLGT
ncbi:MAG TPA: ABC transporter ATP-binding protein [Mycobacteriales bacterium]|jgi:branched-chain amino acid transport system ATP-binding protein|nr:ABC transporter ATP-binding protein [Mycobacteriales bacterium]